jgi:hypothetical protein
MDSGAWLDEAMVVAVLKAVPPLIRPHAITSTFRRSAILVTAITDSAAAHVVC